MKTVYHAVENVRLHGAQRRRPEWIYISQESAGGGSDGVVGVSQRPVQRRGFQVRPEAGEPRGTPGYLGQQSQELHGRIPQHLQLQQVREQGTGRSGQRRLVLGGSEPAVAGRREEETAVRFSEAVNGALGVTQEQAAQQGERQLYQRRGKSFDYLPKRTKTKTEEEKNRNHPDNSSQIKTADNKRLYVLTRERRYWDVRWCAADVSLLQALSRVASEHPRS